jgi:hypothetical protein
MREAAKREGKGVDKVGDEIAGKDRIAVSISKL